MTKIDCGSILDQDALSMDKYSSRFECLTSGQKASITRIMNGNQRKKSQIKKVKLPKGNFSKKYVGNGKMVSRNFMTKLFDSNGIGNILALESTEQKFVKSLPNHTFVIFEHDPMTYEYLKMTRCQNIIALIKGDIGEAKNYGLKYKYAWLDLCDSYGKNEQSLYDLRDTLKDCDYIAFTFSQRNWRIAGKKKIKDTLERCEEFDKIDTNDYGFYLVKKLQSLYRNHEYYKRLSYRDGNPMICMVMKRRDLPEAN